MVHFAHGDIINIFKKICAVLAFIIFVYANETDRGRPCRVIVIDDLLVAFGLATFADADDGKAFAVR